MPHYNLYNAAKITGNPAPGYSSGQAIQAMQEIAAEVLPEGFGYEWTGSTYQELKTGNQATFIFALSILCVFLFMAALYESWIRPMVIILTVPLATFGAIVGLWIFNLPLDVFGQIGLVMLIGLETKNAILVVEFGVELMEKQGMSIIDSAKEAARQRLRPILMTSFAFIMGVLPMARATGAGAYSRNSLGIVIASGMLISTILGRFVIPVYYVLGERIIRYFSARSQPESLQASPRRRSSMALSDLGSRGSSRATRPPRLPGGWPSRGRQGDPRRSSRPARRQKPYVLEYKRLYQEHWWWRSREAILMDVLAKFCPRRGDLDILDVGCGDGLFFPELERLGGSGASKSTRASSTRRVLTDGGSDTRPLGDEAYRGDDWRFDLITALDVVEHIADDRAAVADMVSMLRPGGVIVVTVPAFQALWDHHDELNRHYRRYTSRSLRNLFDDQPIRLLQLRYLFQACSRPSISSRS